MRRTVKTTGLVATSVAIGLTALSQCSAGLFENLFNKRNKEDSIEKRLPADDCSFGYFSTSWRPWGICEESIDAACAECPSGACGSSSSAGLPGFWPGYSRGLPSNDFQPYQEVWSEPGEFIPSENPETFQGGPASHESAPTPILMTPQKSSQGSLGNGTSGDSFQPESVNSFPRAITTNPELLAPGDGLPVIPQRQPGAAIELPLSPPRSGLGLPALPPVTPRRDLPGPGPTSSFESRGTGITLPPRRATSVTIDIPTGSTGSTLSLPDPAQPGSSGDASSRGVPSSLPALQPGAPATAPTPQPSLRPQPPLPAPAGLPQSAAAYRYPIQKPATRFQAVQHSNAQAVFSQRHTAPPQQFQSATHWQAVPQRQQQQSTNWRVIPGFYQQPGIQQQPQTRSQRPALAPSERVIFLSPPPRR